TSRTPTSRSSTGWRRPRARSASVARTRPSSGAGTPASARCWRASRPRSSRRRRAALRCCAPPRTRIAMKIAYVIYPDFTALDLIGPYEVISLWPDVELHWVATGRGPVHSDHGLAVLPTATPADLPHPDVVVIPGSSKPLGP